MLLTARLTFDASGYAIAGGEFCSLQVWNVQQVTLAFNENCLGNNYWVMITAEANICLSKFIEAYW